MIITLLDHTADPVAKIGQMASICYDSKTDRDSNIRRAAHCKDKGHLSTLRFADATFNISGISRVCSHQLVRVAHAGILQESQRYIEQSHITWIDPPALANMQAYIQSDWWALQSKAQSIYDACISHGMKKEDARYILPQGCGTQLNMRMNFQGWRDMLANRTKKAAQWEIRAVALEIERQLKEIAPEIF